MPWDAIKWETVDFPDAIPPVSPTTRQQLDAQSKVVALKIGAHQAWLYVERVLTKLHVKTRPFIFFVVNNPQPAHFDSDDVVLWS